MSVVLRVAITVMSAPSICFVGTAHDILRDMVAKGRCTLPN